MCLEICKLHAARFIIALGLAWHADLKNKVKLDLLIDVDMLLMIEKGILEEIYDALHQ